MVVESPRNSTASQATPLLRIAGLRKVFHPGTPNEVRALQGVDLAVHAGSFVVPLVLATVLTVLTQHPWVRLTDINYFVDWFPYSVYAGRVDVAHAGFDGTWRVRMFIAAGGLMACAAWRRAVAR